MQWFEDNELVLYSNKERNEFAFKTDSESGCVNLR